MSTRFAVGSLVKARGREWVVLPDSEEDLLVLRPLGGIDDEIAGVYLPLETVEEASFAPPSPNDLGDYRSSRLLRDALRLSVRSSAGPFRSFGKIAVGPRPYQLVPLLMALKLETVRLLIADDVGVGKTIEAGLIAKELLEQGEVRRIAVLCPPHLAPQWQRELQEKFHINAVQVLPSTSAKLERGLRMGETLFDRYPYVVVSLDFIKSDRRRLEFVNHCPEFVIVDEAHTCADPSSGRGHMQRYELIAKLAESPLRHLVCVTATPHAGKEDPFRSLCAFLDPSFSDLPADLSQDRLRKERQRLAKHLVQRRRGDIVSYLGTETVFPEREAKDATYSLSAEYKEFFQKILKYCRETVQDASASKHRQRVRWWAALGLLRGIGSSPAAAAATLRERAKSAGTVSIEEADSIGRRSVLDLADDESLEGIDVAPGAETEDQDSAGPTQPSARRLNELAKIADSLKGKKDQKLQKALKIVRELVDDGYRPIIFCRFIDTAEYLGEALDAALPKDVAVEVVTGRLHAAEREARVEALGVSAARHVLVATDCLAEGINLQEHFDAVVHYDLSWNPTRHEQREGRVDRFGQPRPKVRAITYYGSDNPIDGIILSVLITKHRKIRSDLGIAVPVPTDSNAVLEAILEGLLLRGRPDESIEGQMELFEKDVLAPRRIRLHEEWDATVDREKRSRTVFAQETIDPELVAQELMEMRAAIGTEDDVARFMSEAVRATGGTVTDKEGMYSFDLAECPRAIRELASATGVPSSFIACFDPSDVEEAIYVPRTHPFVDGLASYVLDTALDSSITAGDAPARRAGVMRTKSVTKRTTLLLLRFRFDLISEGLGNERRLLAEEVGTIAFAGSPSEPDWLEEDQVEALFVAKPEANIGSDQARGFVAQVTDSLESIEPQLTAAAEQRGRALLASHIRVRDSARIRGVKHTVKANPSVDLLGIYVLLPVA